MARFVCEGKESTPRLKSTISTKELYTNYYYVLWLFLAFLNMFDKVVTTARRANPTNGQVIIMKGEAEKTDR